MHDSSRRPASGSPASGSSAPGGQSWSGGAEVEELPPQSVVPRGTPRLGVGGTLAVVAIVALLATGFGVLGGRPSEPRPTAGAIITSPGPIDTPGVGPTAAPQVTPWIECGPPQTEAPRVQLQVDGQPHEGLVETLSGSTGGIPAQATAQPPGQSGPIDVPIDVITELWVSGGTCALGWTIDLVDHARLDVLFNTAGDPGYASQNRFLLDLGPQDAGDHALRADLVLPNRVVRATWPIRVIPVEEPVAVLHTRKGDIRAVEGCDVSISFGTGREVRLESCVDDVGEPPEVFAPVRPGEQLAFEIEGWQTDGGSVLCGRLVGQSFIVQAQPGCQVTADQGSVFEFQAPLEASRWTLAFSACGSRAASSGTGLNRVCGTWYANIVVDP